MIQSPLNYTGGKYKLLPQILPLFPKSIDTFVDLFCGGCNVGLNANSNRVIYNDIDENLLYLFNTFKNLDKEVAFELIFQVIEQYGLSQVSRYGYSHYNCNSSEGLGKYNKEPFLRLRNDFNERKKKGLYDYLYYIMLYVIIVYAFNNQIRFNSQGEYNLPVGKRDFNDKMQEKLSTFIDRIHQQQCRFTCRDFREFETSALSSTDFVYIDPPYLITCATYTENDGWSEKDEKDLLCFIDELTKKQVKVALSNVLVHKGKSNDILQQWSKNYTVYLLNFNYSNSSYHGKNTDSATQEVLITNY